MYKEQDSTFFVDTQQEFPFFTVQKTEEKPFSSEKNLYSKK